MSTTTKRSKLLAELFRMYIGLPMQDHNFSHIINAVNHADSDTVNNVGGYNAWETTITVTTGTKFAIGDIIVIINDDSECEMMEVTGVATNDLTVVRGVNGTTPITIQNTNVVKVVGYADDKTTIDVDDGTAFAVNDLLEVLNSKERVLVTGIATNTLTIIRACDNTTAKIIKNNSLLQKVGKGCVVNGAQDYDDTSITIDAETGFSQYDLVKSESGEIMYVSSVATTTLNVIRNFNLKHNSSDNVFDLADNEVLVSLGYFEFPNDEIETLGGATVTLNEEVLQTESDQRGKGQRFITSDGVTITANITGMYLQWVQEFFLANRKIVDNGSYKGSRGRTYQGEEKAGVGIYLVPINGNGNKYLVWCATTDGDINDSGKKDEQKATELTLIPVTSPLTEDAFIMYEDAVA